MSQKQICNNEFELFDSDSASDYDGEGNNDGQCSSVQNRNKYKELSKTVDCCKISNGDACLTLKAVLKDLSMLSPATEIEEEHYVIVFFSEDNYIDHVFLLVAAHIMLQKRFCQL